MAQPSGVNVHNSRNIWHRSFKFRFFPKYYSSISGCALTLYVSKSLILTISWFENLRKDCLVECPVRWIRYLDNWIFQGRLRLQRPLVVLPNINQDVHRTEYCRPLSALMRTQWIRSAIWEISDRWLDDGRTTDKIFYSQMSSISKRRGKEREGWGKGEGSWGRREGRGKTNITTPSSEFFSPLGENCDPLEQFDRFNLFHFHLVIQHLYYWVIIAQYFFLILQIFLLLYMSAEGSKTLSS